MSCTILNGLTIDCKNTNAGGIKNIYVSEKAGVSAILPLASSIVSSIARAGGKKFYKFALWHRNTNQADIGSIQDTSNGSVVFNQSLSVQFPKLSGDKSDTIDSLIRNSTLIIVETKAGKFFLLGMENGMDVTAGTSPTGNAMTDYTGYTLEFSGQETMCAPEVLASIIPGLLT